MASVLGSTNGTAAHKEEETPSPGLTEAHFLPYPPSPRSQGRVPDEKNFR